MRRNSKIYYLALTGVLAALITVFTAFLLHIPLGVNGGYVHFGDALIYIAASVLPLPYAIAAGVIGGGVADLLTAPMWFIPTVIIKALIVLPFTSKSEKILCRRNMVAPFIAMVVTIVGYYLAEVVLYGAEAAFITSVTGNLVQTIGSALFYFAISKVLDHKGIKQMLQAAM